MVWAPNFAYGVGLMASDGNLSSDGRHLAFVSKDLEQVEHLRQCFDITANVSKTRQVILGTERFYYRLQWGDIRLYAFLLDIGLTPKKSLTLGSLKIPDEFFFDFLRGSFDGDGCFYSYFDPRWKNSFMFYLDFVSASERHALWLRSTIERLLGIQGHMTRNRAGTFFHVRYAKKDSLGILAVLYEKQSTLFLSRKKLKIETALRIVGKSLPQGI
ncbi:MAG: hypothetical protein QG636_24 [Patescibacteria group bacterium]|nr:hypothetical protein [Patescibacteria group bacterium]